MKLETQTCDLYAKVLVIGFATVIYLCAPFRCQPFFQMSKSLIGLLLKVYIPSCSMKPQLVLAKKNRFKSKSRFYCHCSAALLGCFDSFSNMEIVHWTDFGNIYKYHLTVFHLS